MTLGPLTNVALALEREPALPRLLRQLVMMVGSYRSPGNTAPTLEWNAGVDPEALAAVLQAWRRSRDAAAARPPGGLRAGRHRAGQDDARTPGAPGGACRRPRGTIVRFASDALRFYFEFHSRNDAFYGAFIHDALAIAAALDPALARTVALAVEVELEGRWTTGETVADWRHAWGREPDVDVAVEADIPAFLERWVERVGDLAARAASRAGRLGEHRRADDRAARRAGPPARGRGRRA